MKEASQTDVEGVSCDSLEVITPAETDNKQLKQFDTQSFLRSTDTVWLSMTPIKHRNTCDRHRITKHTQAVGNSNHLVKASPFSNQS